MPHTDPLAHTEGSGQTNGTTTTTAQGAEKVDFSVVEKKKKDVGDEIVAVEKISEGQQSINHRGVVHGNGDNHGGAPVDGTVVPQQEQQQSAGTTADNGGWDEKDDEEGDAEGDAAVVASLKQQEEHEKHRAAAKKKEKAAYPAALPLILQAVRIVFTSPGDDIGKLPSAETFAQCDVTTMEMLQMTGKERRAVLKEFGVLDTQMPYFIRAVHHVCTTNGYTTVRDDRMLLHQKRSSATWCVKMENPETIKESLLGRPIVISTEEESRDGNNKNKNSPTTANAPSAGVGGRGNVRGVDAQAIRDKTGCVGIRNQGSTCYLNSLIQCLYHLPVFRKAIYQVPVEEEDFKAATSSIPLALQTLFYNLQTSSTTCETTELTGSFGWTARDTVIQHDVHELCRIMLDNLEEKMKKSQLPNVVNELFGGEIENWIQVDEADYRSSRVEIALDMQLVVKECSDIYQSLDKLFEVEVLEGSNAYCLERENGEKSYHRAERGISLKKLPPVLILHLTRFDYDPYKDDMCKIMSRWDFYETIDLKRYLPKKGTSAAGGRTSSSAAFTPDEEANDNNKTVSASVLTDDTDENCEYQLHSIMVHSGSDSRYGHYYNFARVGDKWFKFNDENVTQATAYEVFGCNFGGNTINYWGAKVPKIANGYMLVYIRKSELERVLTPCTEESLPATLKSWIEEKRAEEERIRQEKLEEHLYVKMWVMAAEDIKHDPRRLHYPGITRSMLDTRHPIRRKMSESVESAAEEIATVTGIPPERQQYWGVDYRGLSYRMQKPVAGSTTFQNCCLKQDHRSSHECLLFVQDTQLPYFGTKRKDAEVMITHHKIYDPSTSSLIYLGSVPVGGGVAMHTSNLEPKFRELAELASSSDDGNFFVALDKNEELEVLLEPDETAVVSCPTMPASGDIFIWQRKLSEAEAALCEYPTVQDFKHFQAHKRTFNVLLNQPPNFPKQFELTMATDADFEKVQKKIASELNKRGIESSSLMVRGAVAGNSSNSGGGGGQVSPAGMSPAQSSNDMTTTSGATSSGVGAATAISSGDTSSGFVDESAPARGGGEAETKQTTDVSPSLHRKNSTTANGSSNDDDVERVDWRHIVMAGWNPDTRSPYFAKPKKKEQHTLRTLLTPLKCQQMVDTLYFEVHEHTVEDLESSNPLTFEYFNEHVKSQGSACVLFPSPPNLFVKDVLLGCAKAMNLPEPYPTLRLVDIWRGRLYTIYDRPEEELTTVFEERAEFHIEVVPDKLEGVPDAEQTMINIGHVNKQSSSSGGSGSGGGSSSSSANPTVKYSYHGDPFSLWVKNTDLADTVMERVAAKLDVSRHAIINWKPLLTITATGFEIDQNKPVVAQYKSLVKERPEENPLNFYFALEHAPMVGGRRGNRRVDQSLRINN